MPLRQMKSHTQWMVGELQVHEVQTGHIMTMLSSEQCVSVPTLKMLWQHTKLPTQAHLG
jgi:hypothetical protein